MENLQITELEARAARGDRDAQYGLARKLIYGDGVAEDNVRAVELLTAAAEQGHVEAAYDLGVCYHYGYGVEADLRTAYELYLRSAIQGYGKGFNLVGDFYAEGICVPKNPREAAKWYIDALSSTDQSAVAYAEWKLGLFLADQDREKAEELLRSAVAHGEERAGEALENMCGVS